MNEMFMLVCNDDTTAAQLLQNWARKGCCGIPLTRGARILGDMLVVQFEHCQLNSDELRSLISQTNGVYAVYPYERDNPLIPLLRSADEILDQTFEEEVHDGLPVQHTTLLAS